MIWVGAKLGFTIPCSSSNAHTIAYIAMNIINKQLSFTAQGELDGDPCSAMESSCDECISSSYRCQWCPSPPVKIADYIAFYCEDGSTIASHPSPLSSTLYVGFVQNPAH